jgi:Protein of unknown function (DUF2958)
LSAYHAQPLLLAQEKPSAPPKSFFVSVDGSLDVFLDPAAWRMKAGLCPWAQTRTEGDINMELITAELRERLLENGRTNAARIADDGNTIDFRPVVKLFTPDANCTWLLSEIDTQDPDVAFGLCDLGMGCPELGSVSLSEIAAVRGPLGLPVERDTFFEATKSITAYADEARGLGHINA